MLRQEGKFSSEELDFLLTSVIADNITKTKHSSNRELIRQGIGNAVAGLFGGLPGAGATMSTPVNIRSGGKSRLSGVLHSVTLGVILLGAGRYAALITNSVPAGILITVRMGILDIKGEDKAEERHMIASIRQEMQSG